MFQKPLIITRLWFRKERCHSSLSSEISGQNKQTILCIHCTLLNKRPVERVQLKHELTKSETLALENLRKNTATSFCERM